MKPSLKAWVRIDRLFAPARTVARWIIEPLTVVQSTGRKDAVVMKFFGMGSLIRFLSLCEQSGVDLSRIIVLTFGANREVCEMWGVRGIYVKSGSLAEMILGSINAIRSMSRLKPLVLVDLERSSNLATLFRATISWLTRCRSVGFELTSRHSRACTVYSVTELSQYEIFLKGIDALPTQTDRRHRSVATMDMDDSKVIVNINTSDLLPSRRYDVESFASLIRQLSAAHPRFTFYLTGTADERGYVQRLTNMLDSETVINVAGHWTLTQFARELSDCRLFITGDSAPLHLAASMNVATMAIWGPTQPRHFGYKSSTTFYSLSLSLPCSPCFLHPRSEPARACYGKITCMTDLSPEFIAAQALDVIAALPTAREIIFPIKFALQPVDAIT